MNKPLIPWMGGKRKLADHILPYFPQHECYVEPFCGGAALYFMKPPSAVEVLNDVNRDLVNLYRVTKHHLEELYRQFKWILVSREQWEILKNTPPETLTDVQRAARCIYLQKLAFGARSDNPSFGTTTTSRPKFNLLTLEQDLIDAHIRLTQTTIEQLPWSEVLRRYDRAHAFFYCDPPYWQTAGYGAAFDWAEYEHLAQCMRSSKGKVMLSINDHPEIRELFGFMPCLEIQHEYTVGGAKNAQACVELVYANWWDDEPQVGPGHQSGLQLA